jgi:tetratricopeptide (TPR) repeat protein
LPSEPAPAWLEEWRRAVAEIAAGQIDGGLERQATAVRDLLVSLADADEALPALCLLPGVDEYVASEVLDQPAQSRDKLLLALGRAEAYLACNMPLSALDELERAITAAPDFLPAQIGLGRAYLYLGQRQAARVKYAAAATVCELRGQDQIAARLRQLAQAAA